MRVLNLIFCFLFSGCISLVTTHGYLPDNYKSESGFTVKKGENKNSVIKKYGSPVVETENDWYYVSVKLDRGVDKNYKSEVLHISFTKRDTVSEIEMIERSNSLYKLDSEKTKEKPKDLKSVLFKSIFNLQPRM